MLRRRCRSSGVVSPFLSSGNTAMLANFLIFALLLSISVETDGEPVTLLNTRPLKWVLTGAACVLLAFAARYQVVRDVDYLARDAHSFEQDGVKRPQHNPRMNSLAHEIPRGSIYDRNGIPLATTDWSELERHAADYQALGVDIEQACSRFSTAAIILFGAAAAAPSSATCARGRISMPPTRRSWSTIPTASCKASNTPNWRRRCATAINPAIAGSPTFWPATATCT